MKDRIIIAGGRDFNDYDYLKERCEYLLQFIPKWSLTILCGKASGADTLGEQYALENGLKIEYYPANWEKYGKSAGFIRNKEMVDNATAAICFWDGKSKGTKNTIDLCKKKGIPCRVISYKV